MISNLVLRDSCGQEEVVSKGTQCGGIEICVVSSITSSRQIFERNATISGEIVEQNS